MYFCPFIELNSFVTSIVFPSTTPNVFIHFRNLKLDTNNYSNLKCTEEIHDAEK